MLYATQVCCDGRPRLRVEMEDLSSQTISDRSGMLAQLGPALQEGEYVFCSVEDDGRDWRHLHPLGKFAEPEGITLILERSIAQEQLLSATSGPLRCITLKVYSALEGVGLTASVSSALAEAGIPANVVAAFHHDHVFVPSAMADRALDILLKLQGDAKASMA